MVHMASGGRVMRVHGPFVSDDEIERVTGFLKEKSRPQYGGIHEVDLDDSGHAESGTAGQTMCINRPWPLCCVTVKHPSVICSAKCKLDTIGRRG